MKAASQEVDAGAFQAGEFGPSESAVGGDAYPRFVTGRDGSGEACDFVGDEETYRAGLAAGE